MIQKIWLPMTVNILSAASLAEVIVVSILTSGLSGAS